MTMYLPEIRAVLTAAQRLASLGIRSLLEQKHLYQSIALDFDKDPDIAKVLRAARPTLGFSDTYAFAPMSDEWLFLNARETIPPGRIVEGGIVPDRVHILIPDIKTFCTPCDREEAFNTQRASSLAVHGPPGGGILQLIALTYECQSCKGAPEAFLIRRHHFKLQLCGRAPIEYVAAPTVIPKHLRQYWSGAVIAYQSGQCLAALFLLRTLIEQFARSQVPEAPPNADALMEAYQELLPTDFKSRFPSLPDLYSRLSAALHNATPDAELFETARTEIAEHFDARRLFKFNASGT